jgi:hypothetical protein
MSENKSLWMHDKNEESDPKLYNVVRRYITIYINSRENSTCSRADAIKELYQHMENFIETEMIINIPNFRNSDQSYFHNIIQLRNNICGITCNSLDEYNKKCEDYYVANIHIINAISPQSSQIIIKYFNMLSDILE